MRFPNQPGGLAAITIAVTSLNETASFWRGVLHPLGYGRIGEWPGSVVWAREGAQILVQEATDASNHIGIMLRADSREQVEAIHNAAIVNNWPIKEAPSAKPIAPGYYDCVLAVPGAEGIRISIAHAWEDLPERQDAERIRIAGADPDVFLGAYLFKPATAIDRAVIVLHGYGSDATATAHFGARLADAGWTALCLSQRGWLGSTGREDQGLRQPDDVLSAAVWLRKEIGTDRIGLLGFSQGGQVALLAAAREPQFACVVAFFPCTDLASWPQQVEGTGIADYLEDFVKPENIRQCSPRDVADRIIAPTLLIHGDKDTMVPLAQSEAMVTANPSIQLRVVHGAEHGPEYFEALWPEAVAFLSEGTSRAEVSRLSNRSTINSSSCDQR